MAEKPPENNEDDNGAEASATELFRAVTRRNST
jgi:hypothetical protein